VDTRREIGGEQHGKREAFVATAKGLEDAKQRADDVAAEHTAKERKDWQCPPSFGRWHFKAKNFSRPSPEQFCRPLNSTARI
jgi:hypothetical protein